MKISLLKISRKKEVVKRIEQYDPVNSWLDKLPAWDGEGRWWGTTEILSTFASRYAYFDAKRATPVVLGKSMNNYRFGFKRRMLNGCSEYWLCEK